MKKFKVFCKSRKKMIYPDDPKYNYSEKTDNGGLGYFLLTQNGIILCNDGQELDDWHDDYIPLFQICLTDVDGKEIYEGDIIIDITRSKKYPTQYRIVYDGVGYIGLSNDGDKYGPYTLNLTFSRSTQKFKIVGNIYENPELLNEKI